MSQITESLYEEVHVIESRLGFELRESLTPKEKVKAEIAILQVRAIVRLCEILEEKREPKVAKEKGK